MNHTTILTHLCFVCLDWMFARDIWRTTWNKHLSCILNSIFLLRKTLNICLATKYDYIYQILTIYIHILVTQPKKQNYKLTTILSPKSKFQPSWKSCMSQLARFQCLFRAIQKLWGAALSYILKPNRQSKQPHLQHQLFTAALTRRSQILTAQYADEFYLSSTQLFLQKISWA